MKTIHTRNIFEAAYYLLGSETILEEMSLTENGTIKYCFTGPDYILKAMRDSILSGLADVNLQCYVWKFQELYKKSRELQQNEAFLNHLSSKRGQK